MLSLRIARITAAHSLKVSSLDTQFAVRGITHVLICAPGRRFARLRSTTFPAGTSRSETEKSLSETNANHNGLLRLMEANPSDIPNR